MSEYKLVPVEPTKEMLAAYCGAQPSNIAVYLSDGVEPYKAMIAAAPAVQGEPVAWIRKWSLDGEKPTKERNKNGRMAHPMKYKLREVTRNRCLPDDVALYAAPQPAEQQPDVAQLVEALTELCDEIDKHEIHAAISKTSISWFKRKARAVLAAYRKGVNDAE